MNLELVILALPGILIGLVFHEYAHARMAHAFGDPTPRLTGRLTLDPRAHLDPFGTLLLVLTLAGGLGMFGWARPVQVNISKFRNRFWGDILVSLAGIMMNLVVAAVCLLLGELLALGWKSALLPKALVALELAKLINLWLAAFNFLPIPPLDGWRVARRLIPGFAYTRAAQFIDQFGMFLLMVVVFVVPQLLSAVLRPIVIAFSWIVNGTAGGILQLLIPG